MMVTHEGEWGGGQSSFTRCMLNLNFKILGQMMVSHEGQWGGESIIFHQGVC